MSSPPPTAGFSGGSRLNAMNSTPATFPRNDIGAGAAIGAGLAAGSMARQQDSHYRPPSPNEHHSTSRPRQEYTNSQVSSQPSFASTDAFVDKNQRNQYSPERPSNNVAPPAHAPLNQFYNSDSPRSQRSDVDSPYNEQVHRSESIPPMGRVQRNQDFNEFNASPVPVRQDNNRLAPDLARDNTFRSSVTSSSAGPGINEADLEETVIVGFGGGQGNRSNSSLSNHSSERNLTHGLNTGPDLPLFTMTAIEPYMPERPNELLVQPDDELIITEEVGDQWFIGYNRSRNPEVKGYFPRNCVVGGYY
ncbi:hypothetical protein K7432_017181 [Basidiobolus ranarum]|uniref:SH3 domain-containing protein n=1 Tax=Basidiobolus ranarum TaxID=34480 RepID=A0ABR2WDS1_9FUNG